MKSDEFNLSAVGAIMDDRRFLRNRGFWIELIVPGLGCTRRDCGKARDASVEAWPCNLF